MNKPNNNAIEVKYDGIKNITYEFLEKGVISADIGNPNLSVSDTIISITPVRYYEGKVLNDSTKIGFRITITGPNDYVSNFYYHIEKIVFVFDEERLEVVLGEEGSENAEEYTFSQTEIVGLNKTNVLSHVEYKHEWDDGWKDFVLQPADIKRIAEAHEVGMYIDAFTLTDANGGTVNFRNGGGSFQIEGIQGAMKRAFHYFVDETCYEDYISIFAENKKKALKKEKQKIEAERKKQEQQRILQEQEEQEEIELWRKSRNRTLIILVVSLVFIVIGGIAPFFLFVGFAGGSYSIIKLILLYYIDE